MQLELVHACEFLILPLYIYTSAVKGREEGGKTHAARCLQTIKQGRR